MSIDVHLAPTLITTDIPTLFAKTIKDKYSCIVEIDTGFSTILLVNKITIGVKTPPNFIAENSIYFPVKSNK